MNLQTTLLTPDQPVKLSAVQADLGITLGSWYRSSAALVGHYIYLAVSMGEGRKDTIVPILDTVKNSWRWLSCEGPSCHRASLALYDDWLYWLGWEIWHESGHGGVSRLDLNREEWELCEVKGTGPEPRMGCSLHVHERRKQLVCFGGKIGSMKQNDVHLLDLRLNSWVDVIVKGKLPAARWEHSSWMSGDEFYCFGGFTNEGRLPRDGLNVLHFGLNNVVTWSNMKEAAPLGLLANIMVFPRGDSLLLFGGSKRTSPHVASIWDSKALRLQHIGVGENSNQVKSAYVAVELNSEVFMFGDSAECLRISLELPPKIGR